MSSARDGSASTSRVKIASIESTTTLALQPLTDDQAVELIERLLATAELPQAMRDQILGRADGNPFFLEELLQQMIDRGQLAFREGAWRPTADETATTALPDTVHALLAARIDALGADEKRVLQEASVVGRSFWPSPLTRALPAVDVSRALIGLERRGLIGAKQGSRDRRLGLQQDGKWLEVAADAGQWAKPLVYVIGEASRASG